MRAAFWRRERVHRIDLGDLITLRRWHGPTQQLRVASIDMSWGAGRDGITIHCHSLDHLRIPPEPKNRRLAWLRWPRPKPDTTEGT